MNIDFKTPASHPPLDQELRGLLKGKRLRVTAGRLAVLMVLHERRGPMNHEQVMESLHDQTFDRASIWRVLAELAEKGLLRRMDLGDRVWRYELIDACRTVDAQHPHFLCIDCGDVTCLPKLSVSARHGDLPPSLLAGKFRVRLEGTCGGCST